MKTLALTFILGFSSMAYAEDVDCTVGSSQILGQIAVATSCRQASDIALICAQGTGEDVQLARAAEKNCLAEIGVSLENQSLLNIMNGRCRKSFGTRAGANYQSLEAFCRLDAAKFVNNIASASERL